MKYLRYLFLSILISLPLFASDYNYNIEGIGSADTKSMILENGTKFLLYENNSGWTDNLGNYGKSFCFGRIKIVNKVADEFNLICESIDQNGDKNWAEFSRSDTNMDAGAGNSIFIGGTGIYRDFIGAKCIFSTKYLENNLFFKTKCKVIPEIIKNLERK